MQNALSIANRFVEKSIGEKLPITQMKLQKLIYIANGINLAKHGYPLISERIEAWQYGPVVRAVYNCYKNFGNSEIKFNPINIKSTALVQGDKESFESAWKIAKDIDGIKLSNWTHNQGSPWSRAKEEGLDIIPDNYMQEFFQGFLAKN